MRVQHSVHCFSCLSAAVEKSLSDWIAHLSKNRFQMLEVFVSCTTLTTSWCYFMFSLQLVVYLPAGPPNVKSSSLLTGDVVLRTSIISGFFLAFCAGSSFVSFVFATGFSLAFSFSCVCLSSWSSIILAQLKKIKKRAYLCSL